MGREVREGRWGGRRRGNVKWGGRRGQKGKWGGNGRKRVRVSVCE